MYIGPRGLVQAGAVSAAGALPCPGDDHESGGCSEPLEAHGVLGDSASGVASLGAKRPLLLLTIYIYKKKTMCVYVQET